MPPRLGLNGNWVYHAAPEIWEIWKYGAIHLFFEGDTRRREARGVRRCLQPLQGWLTFCGAGSGGGAVLATGYSLAPLIRGACGRLWLRRYNSGGFSRAWDDVVERQRRFTTPPAACVATLILPATFTPP